MSARQRKSAHRARKGATSNRASPGQWIDVRSESRPEIVHHVYTGDDLNGLHCTCEAWRWGTREVGVLFTCKHIEQVVFGKE